MDSSSDARRLSSFSWCQALNHSGWNRAFSRSCFTRLRIDDLPLPQAPITAMVKGGSVFSLRMNIEMAVAIAPNFSGSGSCGSSGRSETPWSAIDGSRCVRSGARRTPLATNPAPTSHAR
jgi:hypothetical protein